MFWETVFVLFVIGLVNGDPVVTIKNGQIRGKSSITDRNKLTYYSYVGIPYATPPVGNLRFEPPRPAANWKGVYDATVGDKACFQINRAVKVETEDCLYLNVYTPAQPNSTARLPVMVKIHGGGFVEGEHSAGSHYMMENGIVMVSMNYRLGPFGFLSTQDLVVPGNMGLKDQYLALQWVQDNVHAFGGDPKQVTLQGTSAGGASVTFQMLHPKAAGLFRGAIASSSSFLCGYAYQRHALENAYGIAKEIDPHFSRNKTTKELINFLKSVSADKIKKTQDKYTMFSPIMEVKHEGAFLTEPLHTLAQEGKIYKVPIMIGICSEEAIRKAEDMNKWKETSAHIDANLRSLVHEDFYITNETLKLEVAKKIKAIFTNTTFAQNLGAGIRWNSDNSFARGTIRFADLVNSFIDVYFYQFSYHGKVPNNNVYIPGIGRAAHGEEQEYIWKTYSQIKQYPQSDITTTDRWIELYTNFVKYLNPTPKPSALLENLTWPKVQKNNFRYLDFDTHLTVKTNPREFSYKKWVDLYLKYARKPFISF